MSVALLSLTLTLVSTGGFYTAYLYGRHTRRFRWREYFALIAAPLLCVGYLAYVYGPGIISLFVASCVVGLVLEHGTGFFYHKTLNHRLWIYKRMAIGNGYTSWLAMPMWGVAGVVFWLLSTLFGL